MLPFLSIYGILLLVILLFFNTKENKSTIYLGFFFLLISLYSFNQYVMVYSKSVLLVSIFFLNIGFLVYLTGPMLYWYIRSVLNDDSRLKKTDIWHFLPMIIFFIATLPHLFSPWAHKLEMATRIVQDRNNIWIFNQTLFYGIIPAFVIFLSRPILVLGYMLWSIFLFVKHLKNKDESQILSRQHFMTKWLTVLFAFLLILIFSHILLIIEAANIRNVIVFYALNISQISSGIGLIGLLISPFFFPEILYGLPRVPVSVLTQKLKKEDTEPLSVEIKKQIPNLEADYILSIQHKIEMCMQEFKPYLHSDCNIAYFAKLIQIPAHHLAYYFREIKKQSFNDFRNEWRVNHAKTLILEGKSNELTIDAIGFLSGFSSRNTFFTAFKKAEGTSPGNFTAQISE